MRSSPDGGTDLREAGTRGYQVGADLALACRLEKRIDDEEHYQLRDKAKTLRYRTAFRLQMQLGACKTAHEWYPPDGSTI